MNQTELSLAKDAYKNALLYQQAGKKSRLRKKLELELSPDELKEFLKTAGEWKNQCFALGDKAIALARRGKERDCLEFDELREEARALGGNVVGFLYQKFDQAAIEYEDKVNIKKKQDDIAESPKSQGFLLGEITRLSTWGKNGKAQLEQCMAAIRRFYPKALPEANRRKARGEKLVQYKTRAVNLNQKALAKLLDKMAQERFSQYEISIVRKMKDKIELARKIKKNSTGGGPVMSAPENDREFIAPAHEIFFNNIHRNSIPELPPTAEWTILFDETGTDFSETAFGDNVSHIAMGRMVALVVPDYTTLPPCKNHCHAVELPLPKVHAMQQVLLSHQCGIIGIPVNALYRIHAEQWFSCIETLLDLILRLLPIDGKTKVKIYVEQRGKATAKDDYLLQKTCDDCLFHLSRAFPERSQSFEIEPHIIRKEEHPWNGYVDAVAFCWSSPNGMAILKESGWKGSCLIDSSPYFLRQCIDTMEHEDAISPDDWSELLKNVHERTNSLEKSLLKNLGERAQQTPAVWESYLAYTVAHLNSKAINLPLLGNQVSWLSRYAPAESELPPRLRLVWLTVKLAEENHRGCVASHQPQREEFIRLSETLFEEDAPLTCNAALNLAVSYTDEFDFDNAQKILAPWRERRTEVPGLQYYGRLLSSYGQHAAFSGKNREAISYFRQAIGAFGRLSDRKSAALDIRQTSTYLLTSLMDCLPDFADEFHVEAKKYFGGEIADAAPTLAASMDDADKYKHHTLLRYLTGFHSAAEEREAYLSSSEKWLVGQGHPWELIEFYRSILIDDTGKKMQHLQKAYDIAMDGEGAMHVIAAVILGSLLRFRPEKEKEYQELVDRCAAEVLPLGNRLNILREHISRKFAPLELAALILPFNFR